MSDYYDRKRIEEKLEEVQRETQGMVQDALHDLRRDIDAGGKNQDKMLEAFNRMAAALENLTEDIRALRRELKPVADKPPAKPKGLTS